MEQFAIIILAAGSSKRLGYPKQLLPYSGHTLLHHVASEALKASNNVIVVLGSQAERIKEDMKDLSLRFLYNEEWEEGMSSSIRCGLSGVLEYWPSVDAVIIMVTDQPFVSSSLLEDMINQHRQLEKPIVACSYKDTIGVPALFDKSLFASLLELKGQSGAKKIIGLNRDLTATISFPKGYVDIDTSEDFDALKKMPISN